MNVAKLIALLQTLPPEAEVTYLWDGYPYSTVRHVYLARSGNVVLADDDETIFEANDRPADSSYNWNTDALTKQK